MNRAQRRQAAKRQAIEAATSVAEDVAEGRLDPDELDRHAADAVRDLAGRVVGPGDPIWPLQVEIARGVLAADGIPYDELAQWAGVHRDRPAEADASATDT